MEKQLKLQILVKKLLKDVLSKALKHNANRITFQENEAGLTSTLKIYSDENLVTQGEIEAQFVEPIFHLLEIQFCEGPSRESNNSNFSKMLNNFKASISIEEKICIVNVDYKEKSLTNIEFVDYFEAIKQFGISDKNKVNFSKIITNKTGLLIVTSINSKSLASITANFLSLSEGVYAGKLKDKQTLENVKAFYNKQFLIVNSLALEPIQAIQEAVEFGYKFSEIKLIGVTSSELIKLSCIACKENSLLHSSALQSIPENLRLSASKKYFSNQGCEDCEEKGYKGYTGIHSILEINDEIDELLKNDKLNSPDFTQAVHDHDLSPLYYDGLSKYFKRKVSLNRVNQYSATISSYPKQTLKTYALELENSILKEEQSTKASTREQNTLMIIDDDADLKMILKLTFEAENFKVLSSKGGKYAFEEIQNNRPDIIICDLTMPDVNGYDILKYVRSDEKIKNIPIVIYTGMDRDIAEERLLEYKADAILDKTTRKSSVVSIAKKLLS